VERVDSILSMSTKKGNSLYFFLGQYEVNIFKKKC
jgi:hypothetical protein